MFEFDIQRCTRICAASGEPIRPGETFYSVLRWDAGQVVRLDYRSASWSGPPENAIGWWQSTLPKPPSRGPNWAPDEVLLRYFEELAEQPQQATLRYVLALLLVRRRVLRLADDATSPEQLAVVAPPDDQTHHVAVVRPTPEQLEMLERHLRQLLAADVEELPQAIGEHQPGGTTDAED